MRISLSKLIEKYYDKIGYLGTQYTKSHKQAIQISNIDFAEALIMHYQSSCKECAPPPSDVTVVQSIPYRRKYQKD